MRHLSICLALTAGLSCLSGCLLSVHPLHSKDVVEKGGELKGDWIVQRKSKNVSEVYEIDWGGRADHRYDITYIKTVRGEETDVSYWDAHLVKLGEAYYLDAKPVAFELIEAPSQQLHVLGLHSIFRVEFKKGEEIKLHSLNLGEIHKRIAETKANHILDDNGTPVLLLETKELQQFLLKHGESFLQKDQPPALVLKPKPRKNAQRSTVKKPLKEPPLPEKKAS